MDTVSFMGRAGAEAGAGEPDGRRAAASPSDPVAVTDPDGASAALARQRPLEQALAYYRDLYDSAPVGYLLLDAQGGIEDINRTGAAMLGWLPDWLVGKPFGRWVVRDDRALFARPLHELQEAGGRLTEELRIKTRSGWPLQVRLDSMRSAGDGNGTAVCRTVMVDVSTHRFAERQARLMQSRLAHAARVSAVGAMASCLAHDLSQPLGTITLNCNAALRLARTATGDRERLAEALAQACEAAAYAGEITRHLRSFLRKDGDKVVAVALPTLIAEAIRPARSPGSGRRRWRASSISATSRRPARVSRSTCPRPRSSRRWSWSGRSLKWSNALERDRARTYFQAYSAAAALYFVEKALAELQAGRTRTWTEFKVPDEAIGCGFHEAVRGVLSHHLVIRGGKIANYHPYPPTPWNANPRDIYGTPGPYEDAVQGTPIFEENGPDKFKGKLRCGGDGRTLRAEALRREIEDAVFDAAPDVAGVAIGGLPVPTSPAVRPVVWSWSRDQPKATAQGA